MVRAFKSTFLCMMRYAGAVFALTILFFISAFAMSDDVTAEAGVFPKSFLQITFDKVPEMNGLYTAEPDRHVITGCEEIAPAIWNTNYTDADLRLMTCIIYCEANSMSHEAMVGVANVIINRKNGNGDWKHVNTIEEVIYDNYWGPQFSPAWGSPSSMDKAFEVYDHLKDYKGTWKYNAFLNCMKAAKAAFSGEKSIPSNYYYFNGNIEASRKKCIDNGKPYKIMDGHIYF